MSSVSEMNRADHAVVLHDHDATLLEALHDFVDAGLAAGDVCVIVATRSHREGLERALGDTGWDVETARARGEYVALDAAETLAELMVDGAPEREAFTDTVTPLVAGAGTERRSVRIYGEMVALLWAEGDVLGALALERLWHELGDSHAFALLCGYPSHAFADDEGGERLRQVCDAHEVVLPTDEVSLPAAPVASDTLGVLLVDPHELVLAGFAAMLEREADMDVVATASTVEAAVAAAVHAPPDVVVFDPDLGSEDGLGLLDRFQAAGLNPHTVALTATDELAALHRALGVGVDSYVLKQARYATVADAIRQTAAGETMVSPELVMQLVTETSGHASQAQPTAQEQRVLEYLGAGMTNEQIAQQTDMPSIRTVHKHVENLCHKFDARNRIHLVVTAYRHGLIA